jgi:hypothetical protein
MKHLNIAEFYITNVCNLTCNGCNRFNNLKFKGHQHWDDYKDLYKEWSKRVTFDDKIVIIGGEPLMNPTVTQWMYGLRELWPDTRIVLLTNGTYLARAKGLKQAQEDNNIEIEISLHYELARQQIYDIIDEYLTPPYHLHERNTQGHPYPSDYFHDGIKGNGEWVDPIGNKHRGVRLSLITETDFLNNSLISNDDKWTLSNNNPQDAHDACHYVEFKTYNFIKGKLYKCGNVMHYLDLIDQGLLEIPNEDIALLNQYKPLTIENYTDYNNDFYNALDTPIPQCKMCVVDQQFHSLVDPYPKK